MWGERATEALVSVYLSPAGEPLWAPRDAAAVAASAESLAAAASLLASLPGAAAAAAAAGAGGAGGAGAAAGERAALHEVMSCCVALGARTRAAVDGAAARLAAVLDARPGFPPAALALASALHLQQSLGAADGAQPQPQPQRGARARALLRGVVGAPGARRAWPDEIAQAHLLLADAALEAGKHDAAAESLIAALEADASCARAHEILGALTERRGDHALAAECFAKAWAHAGAASAAVGARLAFNHLKSGAPLRAIDVALQVLSAQPDCPGLRADVLLPAFAAVRP